jgi:aryl-alcohol dehydrogenase-like predicted oxidoreductase
MPVVDNSLWKLNIDAIDLQYQHVPDPNGPIEDVVGVMKGVRQRWQGQVPRPVQCR